MPPLDSLVLEIALDPSRYTAGRKQVEQDLAKTKDAALRTGKEIERSGANAAAFFSKLRTEFLALTSAMLSADALKKMVADTTKADDSAGRLSKQLGIAVGMLSQWQNAARLAGGSAEGMAGTLAKLTDELQSFQITGVAPPLLAYIRQLGIDLQDAHGKIRPVNELLDEFNAKIQRFDMPKRRSVLQALGIDEGSINLLIQNRDAFRGFMDEAGKVGTITERDAAAARELARSWTHLVEAAENLGRAITTGLSEPLAKVLDFISKIIQGIKTLHDSEFFGSGKMPWWAPSELFKDLTKSSRPGPQTRIEGSLLPTTEEMIREEAAKRNINPDVAMRVYRGEGFKGYVGDNGSSFGPFQLHYGGIATGGNAVPGLGDEFTKKTGLNARDQTTEREQIKFALDYAREHGWGAFHGFSGLPMEGLQIVSGAQEAARSSVAHVDNSRSSSSSTDVTINGPININGVNTNSAPAVAAGFGDAVRNRAFGNNAQSGAQ